MAVELPPITVETTPPDNTPGSGVGPGGGTSPSTSVTAGVTHLSGQNVFYLVIITSTIHGNVQAWLPDNVLLSFRSNWGPIVGDLPPAVNWFTTNLTDHTLVNQRLTAQSWRGSEPFQLQMDLHFFATQDSTKEVIEPIKRLVKMALPRLGQNKTFLFAPGPRDNSVSNLINTITGGRLGESGDAGDQDIINVYIGNYIRLTRVFISVINQIEFKAKLDSQGYPMEAIVSIQFRTLYSPIVENVDDYFGTSLVGPFQPGSGFVRPPTFVQQE
jgi:hypothetical protein